ncbi:hypothetical protein [Acrocarpospora sp. B8E8]|uniref:hypothetical protein n=1 Tax=Acrocarpospora sp. B8E8 TaxID=3153572 RepID=UPI00325DA1BE
MSSPRRPARRGLPATKAGTAWTLAGVHAGLWWNAPALAVILTVLEAALALVIVTTALYASKTISDRAFLMLPWTIPTPSRRQVTTRRAPSQAGPETDAGTH